MRSSQHDAHHWAFAIIAAVSLSGCALDDANADASTMDPTELELRPNWHEDIAPIVHARCVGCHRSESLAPLELETYEAAAPWAPLMADVVESREMPPWGAHDTTECQPEYAWAHDRRLSETERELLMQWTQLGAPEGPSELAVPLPKPQDPGLEDPSDIYEIPAPIVLSGQVDSFACVSIDLGVAEDVWITGVELLPDNKEVVHHVLIMLDEVGASAEFSGPDGTYPCDAFHLGKMVGSYFPGSAPTRMPDGVGVPFPQGARVVLNFHYHPSGGGMDIDQSSVAVRWSSEPPSHEALISTVGNATTAEGGLLPGPNDPDGEPVFSVPAGAEGHTEIMELTLPQGLADDTRLFMLGPHMHRVGTDIRMTLERDGQTKCLIHDPSWDPDWQSVYFIDAPVAELPTFQPGDRLGLRCTYDNSLTNPEVVAALAEFGLESPITVGMGSAALDEMCMFVYGLAIPR